MKRAKAFAARLLDHASRRHDRRRQQTKAASQGLEKLDSRIWRKRHGDRRIGELGAQACNRACASSSVCPIVRGLFRSEQFVVVEPHKECGRAS